MTSLAMLLVSDVFVLINYYSQILWVSVAASIAGMLWLRYREPERHRPIRVNTIIPVLFLVCCGFLVIFPIPSNPWNTVVGAGIVLLGEAFRRGGWELGYEWVCFRCSGVLCVREMEAEAGLVF